VPSETPAQLVDRLALQLFAGLLVDELEKLSRCHVEPLTEHPRELGELLVRHWFTSSMPTAELVIGWSDGVGTAGAKGDDCHSIGSSAFGVSHVLVVAQPVSAPPTMPMIFATQGATGSPAMTETAASTPPNTFTKARKAPVETRGLPTTKTPVSACYCALMH
jgi:hypothetical protein